MECYWGSAGLSRTIIIEEKASRQNEPKLNNLYLVELISEACDYMRNRLPKKSRISIKLSGESDINIKGDWILLRWAVENLLKNAVDALNTGNGEITIVITQSEYSVRMDIIDTGKGIPRRDWKNIFRPGYSSKRRGWGLGLSLTERIIKDIHGGSIRVLRSRAGKTIIRLNFLI